MGSFEEYAVDTESIFQLKFSKLNRCSTSIRFAFRGKSLDFHAAETAKLITLPRNKPNVMKRLMAVPAKLCSSVCELFWGIHHFH